MAQDSNYGEHGKTRGARFDPATLRALDDLEDELGVTRSRALQKATDEGLRNLGYSPGGTNSHRGFRRVLREIARVLAYGGVILLAFTITADLAFRLTGFVLLGAGVFAYALERLIAELDPDSLLGFLPDALQPTQLREQPARSDGGTTEGGDGE